ncbi:hypothetical protein TRFO_12288 [Tritrichomonas foetus]|uniref:Uncharacterized protein n=1 Tax=Tritrichomonas foetus TaxID=1144522 RepID=A0A1J4J3K9_9EUKA|nr:hypothetical protein TRFO_12288 [Tritrichomonas foetus]|eukprot:OHS92743.1 hypothetical protein TRFO_12288 [Tritrichomonas foetus]
MSSKPIHSYQSNILHSNIEYIQHQLSHLHSTFDSFYHFLNPLAWLGNYRGVILTNEKAGKHFQKHPLKLISNSNELQGIVSIIKNGNLEEYKSIMSKLKIGQYVLFQVKNEIPDFFFSKENSLPVFIAGLNYTYEQKEKSFSVLSRGIRIHSLNWNKCFDSINSSFRTLSDFSNFFDSNNFHSNKPIVLLVCSSKPNHIKEFFGIHYNESRNSVWFYLNENKDKIHFNVVENEKNWTEYQSIHILESFPDNFDAKSQITIIFNAHQNNIVLDENKYYIFWIG